MSEWTKDWPRTTGHYWFYGWPFRDRGSAPKMHLVSVNTNKAGSVMMVTDGHFLYQAEGADGLWQKAVLPEAPSLSDNSLLPDVRKDR